MESLIEEARRLASLICHHPRFQELRVQEEKALANPERKALLERYEQTALALNARQTAGDEPSQVELQELGQLRDSIGQDPENVQLSEAQGAYRELMEQVNAAIHTVIDAAFSGSLPPEPE